MDELNKTTHEGTTTQEEIKTYTEEEVKKMLQSETDRRVTEALKTHDQKKEVEIKERIEKERRESERLAQLSAEEKAKELEAKRIKELSDKELSLRRRELFIDTVDVLSEKGIPRSFADMLIGADADDTLKRVNTFAEEFQKAIEAAVNDKLKTGYKPSTGKQVNEREELEKQLKDPKIKLEQKMMIKRKLEGLT